MDQVGEGVEPTMNVDSAGQEGQEDTQSLTARVDTMSEMFEKIMGQMTRNDTKMDAIMMSLGPQGPQALEMGAIKGQMKVSDEKNEVRFKKLEETVYKNKNKEVRFDETANKVGGLTKGLVRSLGMRATRTWGVPARLALRRMGGFLEILGVIPRAGGQGLGGVRALRIVRIVATLGVQVDRVLVV